MKSMKKKTKKKILHNEYQTTEGNIKMKELEAEEIKQEIERIEAEISSVKSEFLTGGIFGAGLGAILAGPFGGAALAYRNIRHAQKKGNYARS